MNRPEVAFEDGTRTITWPTTRLSVARIPLATRDVVLVTASSPRCAGARFTQELLAAARELGVEMVVTLGALLADSPHTRPVPVSGTSSDAGRSRCGIGYEPSTYEGPTGIVGVLQDACAQAGIPAVSLWAAVPHYVAQPPCPKATLALLARIEDLLDVPVPLGDLPEEARAWQIGVDELAAEDDEIAAYVRTLEEAVDTAELPEASGDAIAREFERYLRRRSAEPPEVAATRPTITEETAWPRSTTGTRRSSRSSVPTAARSAALRGRARRLMHHIGRKSGKESVNPVMYMPATTPRRPSTSSPRRPARRPTRTGTGT